MTLEPVPRAPTCPSGRCANGALLIGVVGPDGTVRYLGGPAPVDEDFVRAANQGRNPQSRFRFAEPCAKSSCQNWSGHECNLIGDLLEDAPKSLIDEAQVLPRCGIRDRCVWFAQRGRPACAVCPLVVHTTA
jgi:hypothetical protein